MKKIIVLILLTIWFSKLLGQIEFTGDRDSAIVRQYGLSAVFFMEDSVREILELDALNGNSYAAYKVRLFYHYFKHNSKEGDYWLQIAAENGDISCQYSYGISLYGNISSYYEDVVKKNEELRKKLLRDRQRGIYWLKKAAAQNDDSAIQFLELIEKKKQEEEQNKIVK